jgi:deoxyribose-phosphate aldolase
MALGAFKSGAFEAVWNDVREVRNGCSGAVLKVIIETGLWTEAEIVMAATIAELGGANYVKTSTGFLAGGATEESVRLLRQSVGAHVGVKAAGGIKSREDALALLKAGADRLGSSQTGRILDQEASM